MPAPTSRPRPKLPGFPGGSGGDASIGSLAGEFKDLLVAYVKQETVDPLKALGRFVAFGAAGAVLIGLGVGLVTLAIVRLLQAEVGDHLSGSLTWVPYTGGLLFALLVAGLAISRIGKGSR